MYDFIIKLCNRPNQVRITKFSYGYALFHVEKGFTRENEKRMDGFGTAEFVFGTSYPILQGEERRGPAAAGRGRTRPGGRVANIALWKFHPTNARNHWSALGALPPSRLQKVLFTRSLAHLTSLSAA